MYRALGGTTAPVPVMPLLGRGLIVRGVAVTAATRDDHKLEAIKAFVAAGIAAKALQPTIARVFPFEEIVAAHRYLERGTQVGKIMVLV